MQRACKAGTGTEWQRQKCAATKWLRLKLQVRLRSNRSIRFVLDAYYELRHKVTWPSFNEARNMTIAVLLLSAAVGALLGLADFGLQHLYVLLVH